MLWSVRFSKDYYSDSNFAFHHKAMRNISKRSDFGTQADNFGPWPQLFFGGAV